MVPLEHIDFYFIMLTYVERKPADATYANLSDKQQGVFYMHCPTDMTAHTTAFVEPVVDHWLERKIAQSASGSSQKDRFDVRQLLFDYFSYISLH